MTHLKTGQKAPAFTSVNQNNEPISLSDYKGKKLVLYFYPKDNTPTCTIEACNLRDNFEKFKLQGYEILGVSPDSPKSHSNFINKQQLPFSLIADQDLSLAKAYGVWAMKKTFGKEYMGIVRTTFVIDENGLLIDIIDKVESKKHTEQILK
jgi:peroxiredoxin Q/BCP